MFKKDEKPSIAPLITGVAGVVAGAAAATILSNQENRKKVGKHIQNLKNKTVQTLKDFSDDVSEKADNMAEQGKEKMHEQIDKGKASARKYLS